ncbi:hypothetical protein AB395_00005423 (plasmid) [Sinorhizobium fredii CCBAU 45436]|nr:hypothetical protein AB395_00005423 [Sinorhizobium fredii CCBAU 45436]
MLARLFRNLAVPVVVLLLWQLLSSMEVVRPEILPSPTAIAARWFEYLLPQDQEAGFLGWLQSSELLSDLFASLKRVVLASVSAPALPCRLGS